MIKEKTQKPGVIKTFKVLYSIMNKKDKAIFFFILFAVLFASFACLIHAQVVPIIVGKLTGDPVNLFGIHLVSNLDNLTFCIIVFVCIFVIWSLAMLVYYLIDIFSKRMIIRINEYGQELILTARKNLNFGITTGEINYIIKSASDSAIGMIEPFFWSFLKNIFIVIFCCVQIAFIDWVLLLVMIVMLAVIISLVQLRVYLLKKLFLKIEDKNAKINNFMLKNIINLPLITSMQSKLIEIKKLSELNKSLYGEQKKTCNQCLWYWVLLLFIEYAFLIVLIVCGLLRDSLSVTSLILVLSLAVESQTTTEDLGYDLSMIQKSAVQIYNLNKLKPKQSDLITYNPNTLPEIISFNSIRVDNIKVNFGKFSKTYNSYFEKGKIYALIGKSGSGKTTLLNTMLGLVEYEGREERIVINDNQSVRSLFPYLNKVSFVFQNSMLFDRSIYENMIYPDETMSAETKKLVDKFKMNNLLNRDLENEGVATGDGENRDVQLTLSGGEIKRIQLIRGLNRQAEIYVFDEPTNELDSKNVDVILKEILKLKKRAMVFVISHDKKVVDISDEIINLD